MKILVTGAAGFIGYHVSLKLLQQGHKISAIDNLADYYDLNLKKKRMELLVDSGIKFFKVDINQIDQQIDGNFDLVLHLAAQPGVRLPLEQHDSYINSNIKGFNSIISFINKFKIKNLIYASSSSVYSGHNKLPYSEDIELRQPTSFYGSTKIMNECLAGIYSKKINFSAIGLRFFTVYGSFGRPDMAYYNFASKIVNKEKLKVFGEGFYKRDMTHINDIVDGIFSSMNYIQDMEPGMHEIFNLGNDKPISIKQVISILEQYLGVKAQIQYVDQHNETPVTHACLNKSSKLLDYRPKIDIMSGLEEFIDWFKRYNGF